jgi:hypothetical protein
MDPLIIFGGLALGSYLLWKYNKDKNEKEKSEKIASVRLQRDKKLYENINRGMRELRWMRQKSHRLTDALSQKHGDVLFENADMIAYRLKHFAEYRVGFYFKDLDEHGIYSLFVGNEDDEYESYYRTDRTFEKEEWLYYEDD